MFCSESLFSILNSISPFTVEFKITTQYLGGSKTYNSQSKTYRTQINKKKIKNACYVIFTLEK